VRDRYSLVVGLIFAAVIAIATINTLEHKDEGTLGLDKLASRWPLPEFAVPDAAGGLERPADTFAHQLGIGDAPGQQRHELLAAHRARTERPTPIDTVPPRRQLTLITCMDARLDLLGYEEPDIFAH